MNGKMRTTTISGAIERALTAAHGPNVPAHVLSLPELAQPHGFVLALHGGGWTVVGPATLPSMDDVAARWADRGWAVLNADYRAGGASVDDAMASWDALRTAFGPGALGVAAGKSAGGHLALMVASRRPDVAAVVAKSAPTHLASLGGFEGANNVARLAREFFTTSPGGLTAMSPAEPEVASRIGARLLLAASAADEVVPPDQLALMAAARPGPSTTAMVLEPGPREFIHAGVSDAAFARFVAAEDALARELRAGR